MGVSASLIPRPHPHETTPAPVHVPVSYGRGSDHMNEFIAHAHNITGGAFGSLHSTEQCTTEFE
jgi:hypothetical protein